MQRLIESIANGIGNTIAFAAETGVLFVLFVLLWAAFGAALIWSQGSLDATWSWVRSLHFVAQAVL